MRSLIIFSCLIAMSLANPILKFKKSHSGVYDVSYGAGYDSGDTLRLYKALDPRFGLDFKSAPHYVAGSAHSAGAATAAASSSSFSQHGNLPFGRGFAPDGISGLGVGFAASYGADPAFNSDYPAVSYGGGSFNGNSAVAASAASSAAGSASWNQHNSNPFGPSNCFRC